MAHAYAVFVGTCLTFPDIRYDYGEDRYLTFGFLDGRMVVLAWTYRGDARRIISLRKANAREERRYRNRLGGSG
ncbi:BrnT family toxin [Roseovarius spongiae]|uniref:BrnT family toxin n=1 Tax=Roseovarius spongiae TaxID=2320272 RepID=UPI00197EFBD9|nr:BrnT family toxin [Roseovarius spongiae]